MSRPQSKIEERWNSLTHGSMAILLLLAMPAVLLHFVRQTGKMAVRDTVGVAIFVLCLILMFATSSIYHGIPEPANTKEYLTASIICRFFSLSPAAIHRLFCQSLAARSAGLYLVSSGHWF